MTIRKLIALLALAPTAVLLAGESTEAGPAMSSLKMSSLPPADKETHDTVKALIRSLTAESFGEREKATKLLV